MKGVINIIKSIPSRIWIDTFQIKFEYETKRKNKKEQIRELKQLNQEAAKRDFWIWIQSMSEKEPHRAMLNVNILSVDKVSGEFINL